MVSQQVTSLWRLNFLVYLETGLNAPQVPVVNRLCNVAM